MKVKFFIIVSFLLSVANGYSQFKINADGSAQFKVGSYNAGFTGSSSSYSSNVSFGYKALNNPSVTQNFNVAFGNSALFSNAAGYGNTAIGGEALLSNSAGYYNTAGGLQALYSNTSGYGNTANGITALYSNTTGSENTAIGGGALAGNTNGTMNTAIGYFSLPNNTSGGSNIAVGDGALANNIYGSNNTAVGDWSLSGNTSGNYNTAIGSSTRFDAGGFSNSTAIGYYATISSSNQIRLGNTSVGSIGGYAAWSNLSDGRAKKNIKADVPGLDFIRRLKPVTYNLDLDAIDALLKIDRNDTPDRASQSPEQNAFLKKSREAKEKQLQTGFIAQEVEETAKSIGYNFSGVDVDDSGIYALRYAEFVVPLVKAVQELSEQNERLQEQVKELTGLVNGLLGKENAPVLRSPSDNTATTGLPELSNSGASLYQNSPNPFTEQTEIRYSLPANVQSASVCVFDMQGKILKKWDAQAGEHTLNISGSELKAGTYLYSLIVSGKKVDTKRMILTK